jgi:hypothetical protein
LRAALVEQGLEVQNDFPLKENRSFSLEPEIVTVALYIGNKVLDATVGMSVESIVKSTVAKIKDRPGVEIQLEVNDEGADEE